MEIRRSYDRLISILGFPILSIESGPCSLTHVCLTRPRKIIANELQLINVKNCDQVDFYLFNIFM